MKQCSCLSLGVAAALGIGSATSSHWAEASGFALPEISAAGVATANALVANPEEPGAFAYNPAAMGFHDSSSLAAGVLFIDPTFSVRTATGSHDSDGASWVPAPMLQGAFRLSDNWRIGLGVNAPFGLETRWKLGTFPAMSESIPIPGAPISLPAGLDHPDQSKLELFAVVPTLTYRINDQLSIAAGADYYNARTVRLNTHVSRIDADGQGWGWNASLLFKQDAWSVGVSYHSAATVDVDGNLKVSDPVLVALGSSFQQDVEADLKLPWRLQLGVRYAVNEKLALEADWARTGWSKFEEIKILSKATGALIQRNIENWEDANSYRFALTYQLLPATQLRFGYSYDETGADDDFFTARIPDNDRHLFGLGVGHRFDDGWALDASYMYVRFKDRNYRGNKPYLPGEDVNGTDAFDGKYEGHAHLVAVEVRKSF